MGGKKNNTREGMDDTDTGQSESSDSRAYTDRGRGGGHTSTALLGVSWGMLLQKKNLERD